MTGPNSTTDVNYDPSEIANQLRDQNVSFVGGERSAAKIIAPITGFTLKLTGSYVNQAGDRKNTTVKVPFGTGEVKNAPQFQLEYTQEGKKQTLNPNGMTFQIAKTSKFNPLNFTGSNGATYKITATRSASDSKNVNIKVLKNDVDTTKSGSFGVVQLQATNSEGKSSIISFTILVSPEGKQKLNLMPSDWVGAPEGYRTFVQGAEYYIGNETKIENGVSYTRIYPTSDKKDGVWFQTMYLANPYPAPKIVEKTVMHRALAYSLGGGSKYRHYPAFKKIYVKSTPVEFKGGKYYQVFEKDGTYTSDYLKVSNIDGTKRTLKHNAYVYATSTRRADRQVLKKGTKITTYGGSYKFKNGKRYYRIEGATKPHKRYVRVSNFE